jgi:hypothetical protein
LGRRLPLDGDSGDAEDAAALAHALERDLLDPERAERQRDVIRAIRAGVLRRAREELGIHLPDESEIEPLASDDDLRQLTAYPLSSCSYCRWRRS